jgi:ribokinase
MNKITQGADTQPQQRRDTIGILTFGSCGLDRIFNEVTDSQPEPQLIYEEEGRKSSHQAVAAKRAGRVANGAVVVDKVDSILVSFVGDDPEGQQVLESLRNCGIDTQFVFVVEGVPTEVNHQYLHPDTKDYRLERFSAILADHYTSDMVEQYKEQILGADFVILVSKQPKDFLTATIDFCYANQVPTILTVSHKNFDISDVRDHETLRKTTFIAANFQEAEDLTGKDTVEDMLKLCPNLIITMGGDGGWFCDESSQIRHEPAVPVENIVETNGAGDTFAGNFVVYRAEGHTITESVRFGQCAASIEISKMGVLAAMPNRNETEAVYNRLYA